MINLEFQPPDYLSKHVESFWELQSDSSLADFELVAIPPELNYDIIFLNLPISYKFSNHTNWTKIDSGAYLVGLLTQGMVYKIPKGGRLFCIRLKPFSLANIVKIPLCKFNNRIVRPTEAFEVLDTNLLNSIATSKIIDHKIDLAVSFVARILKENCSVNQDIRRGLNFILRNKGNVKVSEMLKDFSVSNVTLRNHFMKKIGLTAKGISKIYRFHYSLELIFMFPSKSLTELALEAGYYDQSHYIKDFHSFFNSCPKQFFKEKYSIDISQQRIMKRFADFYDPY